MVNLDQNGNILHLGLTPEHGTTKLMKAYRMDLSALPTPKQLLIMELKDDREHLQEELGRYLKMKDDRTSEPELLAGSIQEIMTILGKYRGIIRENS